MSQTPPPPSSIGALLAVIHDALQPAGSDQDSFRGRLVRAAMNAWMEGHIEGEGRKGGTPIPQRGSADLLPSPPFPAQDDGRLRALLAEASERFDEDEVVSAVTYVAALAWREGIRDGDRCSGCTYRGSDPRIAAEVRAGLRSMLFTPGHSATVTGPTQAWGPVRVRRTRGAPRSRRPASPTGEVG